MQGLRLTSSFIAPMLLLILSGCQKPTDLSTLGNSSELVIISNFTANRALNVVVTKTRSILESEDDKPYIENATVELYEEDGHYIETLTFYSDSKKEVDIPFYATNELVPQAGKVYTIVVSAPGYETVTAESKIPAPIDLLRTDMQELSIKEVPGTSQLKLSCNLTIDFQDPGAENNYYHISLLQELRAFEIIDGDTIYLDLVYQPLVFDSEINTNSKVAHLDGGILLSDEAFNGKVLSYELPVRFQYDPGRFHLKQLIVELRVVTEAYYQYFASLSRQKASSGEPFSEPVIIQDNVEGGQGIFAGYSGSSDSLFINR
jgi:hypothetical protein